MKFLQMAPPEKALPIGRSAHCIFHHFAWSGWNFARKLGRGGELFCIELDNFAARGRAKENKTGHYTQKVQHLDGILMFGLINYIKNCIID